MNIRSFFTCGVVASMAGAALLLSACSFGASTESPDSGNDVQAITAGHTFGMNDLSILYPLKQPWQRNMPGRLPRLNEGSGLITDSHFDLLLEIFEEDFNLDFSRGGQAQAMNRIERWGVVGIRIDHCFKISQDAPCKEQVRLVAQAFVDGDFIASDFAMHLFYEPETPVVELLKELIRIRDEHAQPSNRAAAITQPLQVHPILKKEGLNSDYAIALKNEFLLKYLNPENLVRVAVAFIEPDRLQPWIFFTSTRDNFRKPLDNSIFMFDPGTTVNDCRVQNGRMICAKDLGTGAIVDSPEWIQGKTVLDEFLSLTVTDPDPRTFLSAKPDEKKWEGVLNELENPHLSTPSDTNCASCHRTQTERFRFGFSNILDLDINGLNAYVFEPVEGCAPGNGMDYQGGTHSIKTINVRMFGYTNKDPIIADRVVNETYEVCKHFKTIMK